MPAPPASTPPATRPAVRPPDTKLVRYHDYIDQKIESTRRLVKVVDLATSVLALALGVLAFLFVIAIAEHWLVPGGLSVAARWVFFGGLAAYIAYFAYRRLWPLCVRAINPVYAAQTIEQSSPTLKNSLINLLLFRDRRSDVSDAVYRTLEEQAAHGLTRVEVDASVDQTRLIRLGYVLIAVVAAIGLYKILSPKDPLVAAERVLMPWADIVPASRVAITEIKPGAATISRGEFVDVSAEVRGLREDESVVLRYTTSDGQVVGRAIAMKAAAGDTRFTCRLADETSASDPLGVTRNLVYWLEAGDARSLVYPVTVLTAPSILVERVDFDYPAYTGLVDHSVEGAGDIRAIEGTKVTVHARANDAIREAHVDFDADARRDLSMTAVDSNARATFELALREDRQTPRHASYVLRFTNDDGRTNLDPVKHAINVVPDLSPEATVRLPEEKTRDARVDEQVAIEVEASDPDFALAAVRLRGKVGEGDAITQPLLSREQRGRFAGRYVLVPSQHGLKPGDVLEYWVEADDNRTPKPNTAASDRKSLRIISPDPEKQPPQNQGERNDQRPNQQQGEQGEQGNQGQQGGEGQKGAERQSGGAGDKGGEAQQGQNGGEQKQGEKGEGQQAQGGDQGQGEQSQQGESKGEPQAGSGEAKRGDKEKGAQGDAEAEQSKGDESAGGEQGQSQASDKQTGAGAAGGEQSKDAAQPAGSRPDATQKTENERANGQGQASDKSSAREDQQQVSSDGDNDAEAFKRIEEHLHEKGELKDEAEAGGARQNANEEKLQDAQSEKHGDAERKDSASGDAKQRANDEKQQPGSEPQKNAGEQQGENKADRGEGSGAETRNDDVKTGEEPKDGQQKQEKSPGGEQTSSKGPAGDGHEEKSQGAPNSKPEMRPRDKKPEQAPSNGEKTSQQEPPAGANSKKESDSHGDEGGDKAGGGEEGGGQKSPREGTGSAGANQSADNGGGQSGEKGQGENSNDGGDDAKANERTGTSDGKTKGEGSEKRDGAGEKAGGAPNEGAEPKAGGDAAEQKNGQREAEKGRQGNKEQGKQGEQKGDDQAPSQTAKEDDAKSGKGGERQAKSDPSNEQQDGGESAGGGGQPGGAFNPQPSITGEAPEADAANLEYARKQTDLVVEKLADQLARKKVDEGLLKDLGWSEAELKRFVERWQQRKAAAERTDEAGEAAKRELDDALRSLGLKRGAVRQNAVEKDSLRDLREGYRGPVPPEYKERLKAYNQGVSRARQEK